MERLSGLDAVFVAAESDVSHLHVLGVAVVDPTDAPGRVDAPALRRVLAARLDDLAPLRRALRRVPFDLEEPTWVEAEVDLGAHVHGAHLPAPGGADELSTFVAGVATTGLDLTRPPWEMWLVDGLVGGRRALVAKIHHSVIDGVAAIGLIGRLFDLEPVVAPAPATAVRRLPGATGPARPAAAAHGPVSLALGAVSALGTLARRPAQLAEATSTLARSAERLAETLRAGDRPGADDRGTADTRERDAASGTADEPAVPFRAPRLGMNGTLGPQRRIAYASIDRPTVDAVRAPAGATVNDIVLAVLAGALRRYLARRGELPDRPLVAVVPTSLRGPGDEAGEGNRVSVLFTHLPVHVDDPAARLAAVLRAVRRGKAVYEAVGGETLPRWAALAPSALVGPAMRLANRLRLADVIPPVANLVVSNVPGPPIPLFLAGGRVVDAYAHGPVLDGVGLNVTVLSYLDRVGFGLLADAGRVPDLDDLAADLDVAATELRAAVAPATVGGIRASGSGSSSSPQRS